MKVQLGVRGTDEEKHQLLKFEEVPQTPELRAGFTFLKGEEVLSTVDDVLLVPDC